MALLQSYLTYNGNCREAVTFYHKTIGGEMKLMTFGESPMADQVSESDRERIMHANITNGEFVLMAADTMPGQPVVNGSSISLSIACTREEIDRLFAGLSEGGNVVMPLGDQFWGARFGMFIDKFGIPWMLNSEHKQ